jgi:hypothetical protein
MGILMLIFCIMLAYFIGKLITKKNILKWRRTDNPNDESIISGDANSPDAPWMKKED